MRLVKLKVGAKKKKMLTHQVGYSITSPPNCLPRQCPAMGYGYEHLRLPQLKKGRAGIVDPHTHTRQLANFCSHALTRQQQAGRGRRRGNTKQGDNNMRNENEKCPATREHNNLNEQPTRKGTKQRRHSGGGWRGGRAGFKDEYKLPAEVTIN